MHCIIYELQADFDKTNELVISVNIVMSVSFTIIYVSNINSAISIVC